MIAWIIIIGFKTREKLGRGMFDDIKKGFFIGLGLLIPLFLLEMLVLKVSVWEIEKFSSNSYEEAMGLSISELGDDGYESEEAKSYKNQISLSATSATMQGKQVLITGQYTVNSTKPIYTLELEAELFDKNGEFVYECTKSFYEQIDAGTVENYMIKCGCSENGIPNFETVKVKVSKATSY